MLVLGTRKLDAPFLGAYVRTMTCDINENYYRRYRHYERLIKDKDFIKGRCFTRGIPPYCLVSSDLWLVQEVMGEAWEVEARRLARDASKKEFEELLKSDWCLGVFNRELCIYKMAYKFRERLKECGIKPESAVNIALSLVPENPQLSVLRPYSILRMIIEEGDLEAPLRKFPLMYPASSYEITPFEEKCLHKYRKNYSLELWHPSLALLFSPKFYELVVKSSLYIKVGKERVIEDIELREPSNLEISEGEAYALTAIKTLGLTFSRLLHEEAVEICVDVCPSRKNPAICEFKETLENIFRIDMLKLGKVVAFFKKGKIVDMVIRYLDMLSKAHYNH